MNLLGKVALGGLGAAGALVATPAVASANFDGDGTWTDEPTMGVSYTNQGNGVGMIQYVVGLCGPTSLWWDGYFGSATASAVAAYQSAEGITSDGIVGPDTYLQLRHEIILDYVDGTTQIFQPRSSECGYVSPPNENWAQTTSTWKWRVPGILNQSGQCYGWVNTAFGSPTYTIC